MGRYLASIRHGGQLAAITLVSFAALLMSGCTAGSLVGASGPGTSQVKSAGNDRGSGIRLIDVTGAVTRKVIDTGRTPSFAEKFGGGSPVGTIVGRGDVLNVSIWEAPPAALFGASSVMERMGDSSTARQTAFSGLMVGDSGTITIPFAGEIQAAGRKTQDIAGEITRRLRGKAHLPQVIVQIAQNATTNVTVVGEVGRSLQMPLTPKGERLLDALAAAGGARQPVGKTTLQLSRGSDFQSMALEDVIRDPRQNILLQANDVVTALYQPFSFTVLGAAGKNDEINFEGNGITLAQALGRIGGLQDTRADPGGVFIFRFETPSAISDNQSGERVAADGSIPVIYRVNLKKPDTFFIAQSFPIRNGDIIYITNSAFTDIQKFLGIISSTIIPIATVDALTRN